MKAKDLWMLIVGLLLVFGTIFVDRIIVELPDLLQASSLLIAMILVGIYAARNSVFKKQ